LPLILADGSFACFDVAVDLGQGGAAFRVQFPQQFEGVEAPQSAAEIMRAD
jgi:hypothetical protein